MAENETTTEAADIIAAARLGVEPTELELGHVYGVVDSDGNVHVLDLATDDHLRRTAETPKRKSGQVRLTEHPSFSRYVTSHAIADQTTLWGDREAGSIVAVLNDHRADQDMDSEFTADWRDHRATLTLRKTPAWDAWTQASGRMLDQQAFAEFLEDRSGDVVTPDHAVLLEVATSIEGTKGVAYKQAVRLDTGEVRFRYEETVDARAGQAGDLVIPQRIELAISPFEGMDPYRVAARFRYRIDGGGSLKLGVVLDRPEDILRAAFGDVVEAVEHDTGLVVMHGAPA